MQILLNGKKHALEHSMSVQKLLQSLGMEGKPVVVEINKKALLPREFADIQLADGDQVEIITIAAGG
ncbi:MAG: sulfur carrier protein ThiS [Verrucomicrobiae bacterium]|nr:sulfur carrier protein ThiS [Verrucomicrobiae bacterium]NNJ87193.1 sulfur carrier protein ThiS [Akkermansiaceae bacterium]